MGIVFLFPGQGAQYVGMGKELYDAHASARAIYEQADDLLGRWVSRIVFEGPEETLTETRNSQLGIYITSMATLAVIREQFPDLYPDVCAGLSLGEYSAVTASGRISFADCLPIVQARGEFMNDACEATEGTMAAVIGLSGDQVADAIQGIEGLWVANYNCPGQVVISGTKEGVARGMEAVKEAGAKRALPLNVHGAFHSGLMEEAQRRLTTRLAGAPLIESETGLVMNVSGDFVSEAEQVRQFMGQQVTSSVKWEQSIRAIEAHQPHLYVEIGCGKTLAGFNKRIGVEGKTINVDKLSDLEVLGAQLEAVCV